ncbi:MAG: glycoside hydrolase family 15 protein [Streptomyces sp.]|uniref:glycoside hydrolase family 15 protein n=1 Tax=Streptomyces sp. TaxID=1931 RepID=UPI003D6C195B
MDVILRHQHPSGGYPACPTFEVYGYSWFRDGAFIAEGADRAGATDSARAFHDWCARVLTARAERIERIVDTLRSGGTPAAGDWLPARYTLEGADEGDTGWWNFQLDGYGTWLHLLVTHLRRHSADPAPFREAARLACEYLAASWNTPCFDWWEEDSEQRHGNTLAASEAGLRAAVDAGLVEGDTAERARDAAEEIAATVRREGVRDGHLNKWLGGPDAVDSSLLSALTPFELADGELAERTLAAVERDLLHEGGVYRYRADTFYGGGRWPVLAALLGWHYARTGRRADAERQLRWIESQFTAEGLLPEQAPEGLRLAPEREQEWLDRWGPNATPLLWSHGMYLILADELGVLDGTVAGSVAGSGS